MTRKRHLRNRTFQDPIKHDFIRTVMDSDVTTWLALDLASTSDLEAPWYTSWSIFARSFLDDRQTYSDKTIVGLVTIQNPVSVTEVVVDTDDNASISSSTPQTPERDGSIATSSTPDELNIISPTRTSAVLPQTPPRPPIFSHAQNIPNSDELNIIDQPTPPSRPALQSPIQISSVIKSGATALGKFSPQEASTLQIAEYIISTRIPDFVRLLCEITDRGANIVRTDLIIENKPTLSIQKIKDIDRQRDISSDSHIRKTFWQLRQQAHHVFASNSDVKVIGTIVAFGKHWRYQELYRESENFTYLMDNQAVVNFKPFANLAKEALLDTTVTISINNSHETEAANRLRKRFSPAGSFYFLELGSGESDEYLGLIKTRLREINSDIWKGE